MLISRRWVWAAFTIGALCAVIGGQAHAQNRVIAAHSGKCLDVNEYSRDSGANVQQWSCHDGANQRWHLELAADGYQRIVNDNSGKCLDVQDYAQYNGANIQQWECGNGANQQWQLAYAGDGYYMLKARHSGKCLDVSDVSTDDGANIQQWQCYGADNQRFKLKNSGNYTETRYPIVLVHGLSGFNKLGGLFNYFFTIPYNLERSHATVRVASVSAFNSSEQRGEQLLQQIYGWGFPKVNLIAHSQGAPTARYAAAVRPDLVASVTSVDGVNKGSRVADVIRGIVPPGSHFEGSVADVVNHLGNLINLLTGKSYDQNALAALTSLSKSGMAAFNSRYPQGVDTSSYCADGGAPGTWNTDPWGGRDYVRYYSWTGSSPSTNWVDPTNAALAFTGSVFDLPNDGLVDICSARLGQVIREDYDMNHIDAVNHLFGIRGWTNPVSLYRQHANRLKNAGL